MDNEQPEQPMWIDMYNDSTVDAVENLLKRQATYERYSVPKMDYALWVLDRVNWRGDELVLDVGCGPGLYQPPLLNRHPGVRYVGIDRAAVMLRHHPTPARTAQADVLALPYASATFDVIMANHMLFQVEDIEAAVRELYRVLKPDGVLLCATHSVHTLPELQALMRRAIVLLGAAAKGQPQAPPLPHYTFALENGTRYLAQQFFAVVRYDLPTNLIFPEPDPVMAFLESTRQEREHLLPPGIAWDDVMMVMREQINVLMGHFGELNVSKISGALVASDGGGFIHEFIQRKRNRW